MVASDDGEQPDEQLLELSVVVGGVLSDVLRKDLGDGVQDGLGNEGGGGWST